MLDIPTEFDVPDPPRLSTVDVPEQERELILHVDDLLYKIEKHTRDFRAAATMADYCMLASIEYPNDKLLGEWRKLPFRDGAMTIYHYSKVLAALRSCVGRVPTIASFVDFAVLKTASKTFHKEFPFAERMRHVIAHSAELTKSLEAKEKHSVTSGYESQYFQFPVGAKVRLGEVFIDRTFICTFEGEVIEYELSGRTLNTLLGLTKMVFSAFDRLPILRPLRPAPPQTPPLA